MSIPSPLSSSDSTVDARIDMIRATTVQFGSARHTLYTRVSSVPRRIGRPCNRGSGCGTVSTDDHMRYTTVHHGLQFPRCYDFHRMGIPFRRFSLLS